MEEIKTIMTQTDDGSHGNLTSFAFVNIYLLRWSFARASFRLETRNFQSTFTNFRQNISRGAYHQPVYTNNLKKHDHRKLKRAIILKRFNLLGF